MRFPWEKKERRCAEAPMLASDLDLALADSDPRLAGPALDAIRQSFELSSPGEEIAAAIELRKLLATTYSFERLEQLVEHLRRRYATATGSAPEPSPHPAPAPAEPRPPYGAAAATGPPETASAEAGAAADPAPGPAPAATRDPVDPRCAALLAEAESLLEKLKLVYTFTSERDRRTARMRVRFIGVLAVLFVLLLALGAVPEGWSETVEDWNSILNYAVVLVAAATGSVISIMQRLQAAANVGATEVDPIRQVSSLRDGFGVMFIALVVGPAMALVLLTLFVSGFTIEGLTPKFVECASPCPEGGEFSFIDRTVRVASHVDAAKLLIAAFLAGFAERLVPDALDRIIGAAKAKRA